MAYTWLSQVGNISLTTCDISYDNLSIEIPVGRFTLGELFINTNEELTFNASNDLQFILKLYNNKSYFNGIVKDVPNDNNLSNVTAGGREFNGVYLMIAIDETAQKADLVYLYNYSAFSNIMVIEKISLQAEKQLRLYELIQGAIPPLYNWTCIQSVNGKGGLRSFGIVKDEFLSDDMEYIDATGETIDRFLDNAPFSNLLVGNETDWFWAGELDRATVTLGRNGTSFFYTFKFYMAFSTLPFATFNYENIHNVGVTPSFGFMIDSQNEVICPFIIEKAGTGQEYFVNAVPTSSEDLHQYYLFFRGHVDDEGDEDDPENSEPEDDGDDSPWDDVEIEGLTTPGASAVATGFTTMYEVSKTELQNLSDFMWTDNFVENISKFFGDPKDIIVGLAIFPVKPPTESSSVVIKAGGISTGISGLRLTDQYLITDVLGTLYIKKSLKQRFLNYSPYVKITAHLPFVGEHSLDVSDITGKTLSLKYIFDFLTGSCVAMISVDGKPRYFFGGSCSVQIPTSSENFSNIYSGIISAGATLGNTLATLASGGMTAPMLLGTGANMLQNLMSMSPDVAYNSGGGSINGLLSSQMAYLTIETPNPKYATGQKGFVGRPCYMHWKIGDLSGYTKTIENHLENIPCTDAEKDSIDSMLKSGVIIRTGSETPSAIPTTTGNIVISFMKCNSENNVIGKSWDEETGDIISLEGKLIYNQSISTPRIIIEGDIRGYNYCYIHEFGRFYYIKDIVLKENHFEEILLGVDVLQSFKDDILNCNSLVERQENEYNTYYNNSYVWTKQNKNVVTVPFVASNGEKFKFSRENNTYILTVAGG